MNHFYYLEDNMGGRFFGRAEPDTEVTLQGNLSGPGMEIGYTAKDADYNNVVLRKAYLMPNGTHTAYTFSFPMPEKSVHIIITETLVGIPEL